MLDLHESGIGADCIAVNRRCWNFDATTPVAGQREMHASWK
jgi:hypothetical protein